MKRYFYCFDYCIKALKYEYLFLYNNGKIYHCYIVCIFIVVYRGSIVEYLVMHATRDEGPMEETQGSRAPSEDNCNKR